MLQLKCCLRSRKTVNLANKFLKKISFSQYKKQLVEKVNSCLEHIWQYFEMKELHLDLKYARLYDSSPQVMVRLVPAITRKLG